METGTDLKHLVLLDKGQPTSDLTYTLYDQDGSTVVTDTVAIAVGQMSYLIEIAGASNVMSKPLFEQMKLEWTYTTATESVTQNLQYRLHAAIGFAVSQDSVRNMLGVTSEEIPDSQLDLFAGYLSFLDKLPENTDLSSYEDAGTFDSYRIATAIEAATALNLFPTIQLRLPKKYNSGTSEYERWTNVNWEALGAELNTRLATGLNVVDPNLELFEVIDVFGVSVADTDVITAT